jgi:hypothetical protein
MQVLSTTKAMNQKELMDLFDSLNTYEKNRCLSAAGLAIGTSSASKVLIANTVNYLSDGVFKSKTTAEVPFTATTHDIPANASSVQEAVYLITLDASGNPTVTMGTIATGAGEALLPERPSTGTPIGYVRVAVDAGSTDFDASSDDLDDSHLTVAYTDVGYYAPRFDAAQ